MTRRPGLPSFFRLSVLALAWIAGLGLTLAAGEQAPLLRPDFPPYAPYPGLPLNARQLDAWNAADHISADAALFTVYTNNFTLRRVANREDTYARARGRLQLYTAPGDPQFHLSFGAEADRIQFARHDQLSANEYAAGFLAHLQGDHFRFRFEYNGGLRVVPDEDHFSLLYSSYHETRTVHDTAAALAFGGDILGLAADTHFRAIDFPGLVGSRNDAIVTDNLLRLGFNPFANGGPVLVRDPFIFDHRFQQRRGRFDARPIPRAYDFLFDNYLFAYLGTVHLLNPDNLNALTADPAFVLSFGYGLQIRIADFFASRLELGPMRFEMLGDNSTDHPGWQSAYVNSRTVIAPWDALDFHLAMQSGIGEVRNAAYGQSVTVNAGFTYFLNRNCELGLDYRYLVLLASRHALSRHGDQLEFHLAWRMAENWGLDFRTEARRRIGIKGQNQLNFGDTRLLLGLVYQP